MPPLFSFEVRGQKSEGHDCKARGSPVGVMTYHAQSAAHRLSEVMLLFMSNGGAFSMPCGHTNAPAGPLGTDGCGARRGAPGDSDQTIRLLSASQAIAPMPSHSKIVPPGSSGTEIRMMAVPSGVAIARIPDGIREWLSAVCWPRLGRAVRTIRKIRNLGIVLTSRRKLLCSI